ncbi:MAG: hypothetical protein AVDCRST_MAG88-3359, partial [uncultured Thermomicrobiales bacterium]
GAPSPAHCLRRARASSLRPSPWATRPGGRKLPTKLSPHPHRSHPPVRAVRSCLAWCDLVWPVGRAEPPQSDAGPTIPCGPLQRWMVEAVYPDSSRMGTWGAGPSRVGKARRALGVSSVPTGEDRGSRADDREDAQPV